MARILVVDDEVGIRELLSEILYDEGHTVDLAENAAAARALRAAHRPDVVLLDIWMPDTDGVTLLKEWASQELLDMPVIMMSGHATIDTAVEATRIGAIDFLEKPITMNRLLKTIAAALERGRGGAKPAAAPAAVRPATPSYAVPPLVTGDGGRAPATGLAPAADRSAGTLAMHDNSSRSPLLSVSLDQPLREARDAFERVYFEHHLAREGGSMTRVADKTGLERTHLYRKLKQLGIELSRKRNV
ncbi:MAG: response regulator [Pigmentiphaga sp.]|uniref:response regulator n=1 Tax=Pigmentiphaga sp. TaxID=1977564 RepID=UPI0029A7F448|nr:response regulator [Pigmentiphaga sp.]MDX3906017.1 response regulator [Pigmentiphaga sp.]